MVKEVEGLNGKLLENVEVMMYYEIMKIATWRELSDNGVLAESNHTSVNFRDFRCLRLFWVALGGMIQWTHGGRRTHNDYFPQFYWSWLELKLPKAASPPNLPTTLERQRY